MPSATDPDVTVPTGTDAAVIIDAATRAVEPRKVTPGDIVSVVTPPGSLHHLVDLEQYEERPRRKRGTVHLHTGVSLAAYVDCHNEGAATALYADVDARSVVAVLNGHVDRDTFAGWGDHRAVLNLKHTREWERWARRDGKLGGQVEFAEHIEESLADIVEPTGAELLELATSFEATTRVNFKSDRRLDNGQTQILYEETIDARAGQTGQLTIPREFRIGVAPFEGSEAYALTARLRYRLRDGSMSIGYQLVDPEAVVRTAFNDVLAEIEESTGQTAYRGKAPSA